MMSDPGVVLIFGACVACHQAFSFNPHYVPSIRVDGVREPVCSACVAQMNAERERQGLEPHAVHAQAYEPLPAEEL